MRMIEVEDDARCARCPAPARLLRRRVLYCGPNCAAHSSAHETVAQLSRIVDLGGGGSPLALASLDMLTDALRSLEPIYPDVACPKCWANMQGGAEMPPAADGSRVMGERCTMCGHTRPAAR